MENIINALDANQQIQLLNSSLYLDPPKKKGRKPKLTPDAEINEYSVENIEKFIELIEERPQVWNVYLNEPGYKLILLNRLWSEIEQLCSSFIKQARNSGKNAQILWGKLKREFKSEHEIQTEQSGQPIKFRFYMRMLFLLKERKPIEDGSDGFDWSLMLKPDGTVKIEETESSSREPSVSRKRDREETMEELLLVMRESNNSLKKLVTIEDERSSYYQSTPSKNKDLHDLIDNVLDKMPFIDQHLMKSKITQFVVTSYQEHTTGNQNE